MSAGLLEIQPRELKFIFELKKQSSCFVRLVNKSNDHVAFKIKTTSPKKYSVRPNTGVIKPKSACDFTVTMQAQKLAPPDMICKDRFLVQSTVVPAGTTDEDVDPDMFAKDFGRYVEENKMRVILVSPPNSPVLSPINGTLKHVPAYEDSILKDQVLRKLESFTPRHTDEKEPAKEVYHAKEVEYKPMKGVEELQLVKDIEDMKSKLNELESKLSEAEVTISKLTEERRWIAQEGESFRQELALLRSKSGAIEVQVGFPFLFVCMVSLISVMLGYLLNR
ncbi:Vesicle-associated protein 2-2 [Camellia lanceoleosa]|nr:Vesicle-associated protein 2-2 [Camellia lanceoleosa]